MARPFEILEHPADVGFLAYGATLEELFANSALAMISLACDLEGVRETRALPAATIPSAPTPTSSFPIPIPPPTQATPHAPTAAIHHSPDAPIRPASAIRPSVHAAPAAPSYAHHRILLHPPVELVVNNGA